MQSNFVFFEYEEGSMFDGPYVTKLILYFCQRYANTFKREPEKPFLRIKADGCWEWMRKPNQYGYGRYAKDHKRCFSHRFFFELLTGKIDKTLDIDHLCRNKLCCNPAHLEQVTREENLRRGWKSAELEGTKQDRCKKIAVKRAEAWAKNNP